jgi:hypothetical protein
LLFKIIFLELPAGCSGTYGFVSFFGFFFGFKIERNGFAVIQFHYNVTGVLSPVVSHSVAHSRFGGSELSAQYALA